MAMLSSQPSRSSLQVAPLAIQKSREDEPCDNGSDLSVSSKGYGQSEITPPTTPNGSQEDLSAPTSPFSPSPVFHNFLRAFYPFHPSYALSDSTVTLPLNEGDVILVHSIHTNGWADGTLLVSGARGWLPTNYCEAYGPDEMSNLLKALLNFWDLMRSTSVNDSEMFGNQEFMKGIIAGVRYLLERTNCLTRESAIVQRHDGLRRSRKSLLSELSSLVKTAKRLLETQKMDDPEEEINCIIDEMILKAFRIVTKGVRFLDILDDDRHSRAPAIAVMATLMEEAYVPPTPPADSTSFDARQGQDADASSRADENRDAAEPASLQTSDVAQDQTLVNRRLSSVYSGARRSSQNSPLLVNRLSSTISHRVSLAGPSPLSRPQNLVSERLSVCHDLFLSHLGSFIGRLHLQSPSRPHLALAIKQSAASGGDLLVVVDVVCAHNSVSIEVLDQSRAAMYERIQNLVHAARDILANSCPDMGDVIMPQDNDRLLGAATGCVKATGECVAKTKWVIERIGDFEFEFDNGSLGVDLDLAGLDFVSYEKERSIAGEAASIAESNMSEATSTAVSVASSSASRPAVYCVDKPLPDVPQPSSPVGETPAPLQYSPPVSRPQSLIIDDNASSMVSSVASLRSAFPTLPKISTSLPRADDYSPVEQSATIERDFRSFRSESLTASSAGSGSTYLSRDSESSMVSRTSTRATTPDLTLAPKSQPSLSDLSTTGSLAQTEDFDDVESTLLEKTYAHELVFNKEGHVTGGSLAALVERLTTHESTPGAMFVSTFYLTFRLFCTPVALAEALIYRFDYVGEAPHMADPVRLRTYNVFKGWLESHWREESDREALGLIKAFAEFKLAPVLPAAGKRLLDLSEKVTSTNGVLVPRLISAIGKGIPADTPLPPPIITKSQTQALAAWKTGGPPPPVMEFDPLEVARQLTIKQMSLFCAIKPEELLSLNWTKLGGGDANHVKAMSTFTTGLSNLVAETILYFEEVKKRALIIKHWIKIAHQCLGLKNYDALTAITCALTDSSIKRLNMTWDSVSVKRKEMLKTLQGIVDCNHNYKVLRNRLNDHVPPCLPFLGMVLTDLTFVDAGNPDTKISDNGLTVINFDKHTRTAKSIGDLQRFQIPYRLTVLPDFQEWISVQIDGVREKEKKGANAHSRYRKSLALEPRGGQQLPKPIDGVSSTTAVANTMFGWIRNNTTNHGVPTQV
ncbi:ras guanine nucleotide exchange factor domain-containing protein [Podospora didyma]|uniref:Ras guanine nucleotide exchange factor domain-containing protein n=1 Tax=Podospora didyma TaxID=330526 RepID=A0AAE0NS20_9PEZI|nr:ras guanine nucleotide exchange factor domain-containing protein [Podospora didyma]